MKERKKEFSNYHSHSFSLVIGDDNEIEFQPALITLFNRRNSDELSAKESVKEHLWNLHFAEYGGYRIIYNKFMIFLERNLVNRNEFQI